MGCAAACLVPAAAGAASPPLLTQFGEFGSGAGQFQSTRAIAANPETGHVYVTDAFGGESNNHVDEFTAWGEFVKSWGWGVRDGSSEPQTCGPGANPPSAACLPSIEGSGPGQLDQPSGIELDAAGNVYVYEVTQGIANARVQKFSPDGEFLLMFGGGVNQTSGADICTKADVEAGDVCGPGTVGTGDAQFSLSSSLSDEGDNLAIGPEGTVFVGDKDRIQAFDLSGAYQYSLDLPEPGKASRLAADPVSGDLYFAFEYFKPFGTTEETAEQPDVYRLDAQTGAVLDVLPAPAPRYLTVDAHGNVYVVNGVFRDTEKNSQEVISFDPAGSVLIPMGSGFMPAGKVRALGVNVVTDAGEVNLYAAIDKTSTLKGNEPGAHIDVYGPAPDKWPPPLRPPAVEAQYSLGVGATDATVRARINPRFWADTTYYVEYGTAPCAEGGCSPMPDPPGEELGAGSVGQGVNVPGIALSGLKPDTTYHFRFRAQSTGGETIGGGESEAEGAFHTFALPTAPRADCDNQAFRSGPSAFLPDCRAYEMVSPVDKNGGDIVVQCNILCQPVRLDQAAASGGRMTFSAYPAFAGAPGSSYANQYMATRTGEGWVTRSIGAPMEGVPTHPTISLDSPFKFFDDDLSSGLLLHFHQPLLAPQGIAGFTNLYRRDDETDSYEALTRVPPPDVGAGEFHPELQGLSVDGSHVVFRAPGKLTENARGKGLMQVYEYFEGQLRLVSLRPNGFASITESTVGTVSLGGTPAGGRAGRVTGAVSEDGSRIFWSESSTGSGRIYVRIDGTETVEVSDEPAEFIAAAPDGSRAIVRRDGGQLVEFEVDSEQETEIAVSADGVAGASEDLSRIYFVSKAALAEGAVAGKRNLYLYEEGVNTLVATLTSPDIADYSVTAISPHRRAVRISADGRVLVFMSRDPLTGYDNADAGTGEAVTEVYRYEAESDELLCVSCHPSGERPGGAPLLTPSGEQTGARAAARIPAWETQFFAPRALSEDGERLFFESYESLVLRDSNGKRDVYQWQAPGGGECTTQSPSFSLPSGGCVDLISSGESPADAEFLDASADGSEAFFTTAASLVVQDPGLIDVYSARIGGGFAPPSPPPPSCEGEACQGPLAAPDDPTPASSTFEGRGNVKSVSQPKARSACPRGKRRIRRAGKRRCVAKKTRKSARGQKQRRRFG